MFERGGLTWSRDCSAQLAEAGGDIGSPCGLGRPGKKRRQQWRWGQGMHGTCSLETELKGLRDGFDVEAGKEWVLAGCSVEPLKLCWCIG